MIFRSNLGESLALVLRKDELIGTLQQRCLEVDCPRMELIQNCAEQPARFTGPGCIQQSESGELSFKLYATTTENWSLFSMGPARYRFGELMGHGDFYSLTGTDHRNRTWKAERIIPDIAASSGIADALGPVVTGKLRECRFSRPLHSESMSPAVLALTFFEELEFPWNTLTETEIKVGGLAREGSSSLNAARFSECGYEFEVRRRAGATVLEASCPNSFPPYIDRRMVEALQFVQARAPWPRVVERLDDASETVTFTSDIQLARKPLLKPPLIAQMAHNSGDFWRLFGTYLHYILSYSQPSWHPCSRRLHFVTQAAERSIDAFALGLAVTVEGLVKDLFPELGGPSAATRAAVEDFEKHAASWGWNADPEVRTSMLQRLPHHIRQLISVRAIDKLQHLVREGVVRDDHVLAWKRLRNAAAHGSEPGSKPSQELIDCCDCVTVLLYHLIFRSIGYKGAYSDYSVRGWPVRQYPEARNAAN
jgi:hypothetical protein